MEVRDVLFRLIDEDCYFNRIMGGCNINRADLASIVGGPTLCVTYIDFIVKRRRVVGSIEPFICTGSSLP